MISKYKPIGVFDSGLGGISVLKEMVKLMPNEKFIYYGDSYYAPYGKRSKEDITDKCKDICDFFIDEDVKAIVIACNTATSAAAIFLRARYNVPIIGMEPALKVVADGVANQNIVVMATELTLKEEKFVNLMKKYEKDNKVIKIPCPELVEIVENGQYEDEKLIVKQLRKYFDRLDISSINSVVLGCTHFVFLKKVINKFLGDKIRIVDGNEGTSMHLKNVLNDLDLLVEDGVGNVMFLNSRYEDRLIELSKKLFNGL